MVRTNKERNKSYYQKFTKEQWDFILVVSLLFMCMCVYVDFVYEEMGFSVKFKRLILHLQIIVKYVLQFLFKTVISNFYH